jgi:hypothetical protein
MSISMTCACGKTLRVKPESAGKKVRCGSCGEVLKVPAQDAGDDAEFDEYGELGTGAQDDEEDEPALPPRVKRRAKATKRDADRDEPAPRKMIQKGWFESTNGGVMGGILMIVIAVVWFVAGLAGGVIFFYPPILLLIGIISVIKGLFSSE